MVIKIKLTGRFDSMYRDLVEGDEELKDLITEKVSWFKRNPADTRLKNHKLSKQLRGKWAFSITDDMRIVYQWQGKNKARFLAIGPHEQVYSSIEKLKVKQTLS